MINEKLDYDEIELLGYKIHIYPEKLQIFKPKEKVIEDFKVIADKIVQYLMDEMFIPTSIVNVEIISV